MHIVHVHIQVKADPGEGIRTLLMAEPRSHLKSLPTHKGWS